MNQAQIGGRKATELLGGLQIHLREGENARPSPCFDLALNLWSPEKIWLFQNPRSFFQRWMVHVVTSTIMLCAILAVLAIRLPFGLNRAGPNVPLRECLVAPDVPSFTGSTPLSRFRVTLPSRTRAVRSHSDLAQVPEEFCGLPKVVFQKGQYGARGRTPLHVFSYLIQRIDDVIKETEGSEGAQQGNRGTGEHQWVF